MDVVVLIAARRGQQEVAVKLIAALEAHRERLALALPGLGPVERESVVADLRTTLGARFDTLHAEGRELSTKEAISMALAEAARHTTEHRVPSPVTVRTLEVMVDTPSLRVWALGPLQVSIRGKVIEPSTWGSARPRELLAYLLMHPEGRTKEQIGLCFWPDASSAQLRNNFHVTLHRLRKALGNPAWVTLSVERYSIDPMVLEEFDVATFEKEIAAASRAVKRHQENATALLEQAVSIYRGDLLDGEPVGDWHLEHRDALQRQYVDALMLLGARHLAEERQEKAADAYRRVLARDELHEDALLALMRCHAQAGERSQALRLYRRFAERLRDELDALPGKETTRFFESLHGAGV
jgi:DNA-binding SARP family transcriptional activator